jgi:dTMP kinase
MIISFEGLDGCGKSTQITLTDQILRQAGKKVAILREPGGNAISEKIREILLDKNNLTMCKKAELLLYIASRAQLVHEEIMPLIKEGVCVILDRFMDSTTAYQGYGRGIDLKSVIMLNHLATEEGKFIPDITFFLDLDPKVSLSSVFSRGEEINRMESADVDFFGRVRQGFIKISEAEPERVFRIDASGTQDQVFGQITSILKKRKII